MKRKIDISDRLEVLRFWGSYGTVSIGSISQNGEFDYSYPDPVKKYHTQEELIKDELWNRLFVTPSILIDGDYVGSLVERSNRKVIREKLNEIDEGGEFWSDIYYGYGAEGLHIRLALFTTQKLTGDMLDGDCVYCEDGFYPKDPPTTCNVCNGTGNIAIPEVNYPAQELLEILGAAIEDYPLIDEDLHSEMEMEATNENWDSWAKDDFVREIESYIAGDETFLIHSKMCKKLTECENLAIEAQEVCPCVETNKLREFTMRLAISCCGDTCYYNEEFTEWVKTLGNLRERFEDWREKANVYWENENGNSMHVDLTAVIQEINFNEFFREYLEVKYGG